MDFIKTNGIPVLEQCPTCKRRSLVKYAGYNVAKPKFKGECLHKDCQYNADRVEYVNSLPAGIPWEWVEMASQTNRPNKLARWLRYYYGNDSTNEAFSRYFIGTSKRGFSDFDPIYWQIDKDRRVISGRSHIVVRVDKNSASYSPIRHPKGRREYSPEDHYHLFGGHLLSDYPNKPIMIFNYERLAIEASIVNPDYNCLACISTNKKARESIKEYLPNAIWI